MSDGRSGDDGPRDDKERSDTWSSVHLVPRAVARISGWPIETLDGFGDPTLWQLARSCSSPGSDDATWERAKVQIEATTARERSVLRSIADRGDVQRALALTAPQLVDRWRSLPPVDQASRSRHRRLETTVLLCILRGVGRPTPQGAWAGVAPVRIDDDTDEAIRAVPAAGGYAAAVSLVIVDAIARRLAQQRRYQRGYPVRLNPTVRLGPDGAWRYLTANGNTARLGRHAVIDAVVEHFLDGRAEPIEPLAAAITSRNSEIPGFGQSLDVVLDRLFATDVLRSTLPLTGRSPCAADALREFIGRLVEPDRTQWIATMGRLQPLLDALSKEFDDMTPAAVTSMIDEIRTLLRSCWQGAGLEVSMPEPVVTVDRRMPYEVVLPPATWLRLERGVRAWLAFYEEDGCAEDYRRWVAQDLLGGPPGHQWVTMSAGRAISLLDVADQVIAARSQALPLPSMPFDRESVFRRFTTTPARRATIEAAAARWHDALAPVAGDPVARPPRGARSAGSPGPGGDVLIHLDGHDTIHFGPGRPQPGFTTGRFSSVLGQHDELGHALRKTFDDRGLPPVDLTGADTVNPGPAVRPRDIDRCIEAGGSVASWPPRLDVTVGPELRPVYRDVDGTPLVPLYPSAAAIGRFDPLSRVLLTAAFAHGWEYLSYGTPLLDAEMAEWGHLPRLVLDSGVTLSAQRWTLSADLVGRLAGAQPPERMAMWLCELAERGVPRLVRACYSARHPELLIVVDSPVIVSALFERVKREPGGPLVLEEVMSDASSLPIMDEHGGHYFADLALTWLDDGYPALLDRERLAAVDPAVDPDALADLLAADAHRSGAGWTQIALEPAGSVSAVLDAVGSCLEAARQRQQIDLWWFIRKPPGLRVRWHTITPSGPNTAWLADPAAWIDELVRSGLASSGQVGVYEPEEGRFGGPEGLALAHRLFDADTGFTRDYLAAMARHRTADDLVDLDAVLHVSAAVTSDLIARVVGDAAEARDVWLRLHEAVHQASRDGLTITVSLDPSRLAALQPGLMPSDAVRSRLKDMYRTHAEVAARLRTGGLSVGPRTWLCSAIVFHWNRLGLRVDEIGGLVAAMLGSSRWPDDA